jgi:hypothetical protein
MVNQRDSNPKKIQKLRKEFHSGHGEFSTFADQDKAEAKIEFYKRIRSLRREKRMRMEMT